eukprot:COSAG01_NODE_57190_length_313_cov_10.214953_1_plen_68_part_01
MTGQQDSKKDIATLMASQPAAAAPAHGTLLLPKTYVDLDTEILFPPTLFLLFWYLSLRSFFIDYRRWS